MKELPQNIAHNFRTDFLKITVPFSLQLKFPGCTLEHWCDLTCVFGILQDHAVPTTPTAKNAPVAVGSDIEPSTR